MKDHDCVCTKPDGDFRLCLCAKALGFVLLDPRKIKIVYAQIWMVLFGKFIRQSPLFCAYGFEENYDCVSTKRNVIFDYVYTPKHLGLCLFIREKFRWFMHKYGW